MLGRYITYLRYVFLHRWHVFLASLKFGIPLLGLLHDISKYRLSELLPYARHFYNPDGSSVGIKSKTGYYKPTNTGDPVFDYGWFLHTKRNKHHWQYWVVPDTRGDNVIFETMEMPEKYVKEMVCDWIGAGKVQHTMSTKEWYECNKSKLVFHPNTRAFVESFVKET